MTKNVKFQNNRHPGEGRGPEAVDFVDSIALDPGLVVTPEWGYPGRGDGVFFDTLLKLEIFGWIDSAGLLGCNQSCRASHQVFTNDLATIFVLFCSSIGRILLPVTIVAVGGYLNSSRLNPSQRQLKI